MHGADFADYQEAYNKIKQKKEKIIPNSGLSEKTNIPILSQIEQIQDLTKKESQRKLGNIIMEVNGYNFYNCKCGVTIKVPPTIESNTVKCPRCGEINISK